MKNFISILIFLLIAGIAIAQPAKKTAKQTSSQPDMNKLLEDAMKAEGMSKEEQEEMKKMMKGVMPALTEQNATTATYPEFASNKKLLPARNTAKINAIPKKRISKAEISEYARTLLNKLMAKGSADEIAIIKSVSAKTNKANDLAVASVTAMLQGHSQAAMGFKYEGSRMLLPIL